MAQGAFKEAADVHEGQGQTFVHHGVVSCVRGVRDCPTSAPVTANKRVEHVKVFVNHVPKPSI